MVSTARFDVLVLILASAVLQINSQEESCKLSDRKSGFCSKITDCPAALMAWNRESQHPKICGVRNGALLICCDSMNSAMEKPPPKKPGQISAEKCKEYARLAQRNADRRGLCGTKQKKVFESKKAGKTDFPYTVQVGFDGPQRISWDCAGTLISEQYVVTAAHCLFNIYGTPATLVRWLKNDNETFLQAQVVERIRHPDYEPVGLYNDIALLRLESPLKEFNQYIRPACISNEDETFPYAIATGWGRTRVGNFILEDLLVAGLPVQNHQDCVKNYRKSRPDLYRGVDEKTQFCAGGNSYGKVLCNGDFGGPLTVRMKEHSCMNQLIGVTSFGSRCKRPGIYVKVSFFVPWIESIVWPN